MSVDLRAVYTLTAPSATDGRGEVAVLNDPTSGNFVGYLFDSSGFESPEVRESSDVIVEGDGGIHGSFYHGRRPFTMDVWLEIASTEAATHARLDKFLRATNAMRADGTIAWTETGGAAKIMYFRRQQPVRGPSTERRCLFAGVSADPRIYAATESSSVSGVFTVAGSVGTPPRFTVTSPTTTVRFRSETLNESVMLDGLTAGVSVTVDFAARTVVQGGVNKYSTVSFPSSVWWELVPGSNQITIGSMGTGTITGATTYWRSAWL